MLALLESQGFREVWVLDFEFTLRDPDPRPGTVVCMVARDLLSGRELRLWGDELASWPFGDPERALFIAFYAQAEASCMAELGWPLPRFWLDLWAEEVRLLNGSPYPLDGIGLLGTRKRYGMRIRDKAHKSHIQKAIGEGRAEELGRDVVLDYCADDVTDTAGLFTVMSPGILSSGPGSPQSVLAQAVIRGRFAAECAMMTAQGLPWDVEGWQRFLSRGPAIRLRLIAEAEKLLGFQLYDGASFSHARFAAFVEEKQLNWPRLPTGQLATDRGTFEKQGRRLPYLQPLHYLRSALSKFESNSIAWQDDGRIRVNLRPFASKTGRSQPSNSKYPFGLAKWARCFLRAEPGHTLCYLDYRSQEIAIGASLSGDANMRQSYEIGDPYIAFARLTGQVPPDATKDSHPAERQAAKPVVLAAGYGMGEHSMAERNEGMLIAEARNMLRQHREVYHRYWSYVDVVRARAACGCPVFGALGWRYLHRQGVPENERSWGNWPVQTTGSEIMRLAVIMCADAGVRPIGTVHDALVFQFPIEQADQLITQAKDAMENAASVVLGGGIAVDVARYDYPGTYADKDGRKFYDIIMQQLKEVETNHE